MSTVFLLTCVFGLSRTWPLGRVLGTSYAIWLLSVGLYRGLEWWLRRPPEM